MIFVTALGITVILSGLVLVFAQEMRTEAITAANRLAYTQVDAIEQGAEQWVLAQVEAYRPDAVTLSQVPAEALQVGPSGAGNTAAPGAGYFWILTPDPDTDQAYQFGITDEAGKINLNTANNNMLYALPGMEQDIADGILDWRNAATAATSDGAESDYYNELQPEGYDAKNAAYETVDELLLVKDVTRDMVYGLDLNHDGVVDKTEMASGGGSNVGLSFNGTNGTNRGFFNDVTVYTKEPNVASDGSARINVNSSSTQQLKNYLGQTISTSRANAIISRITPTVTRARGRPAFSDLGAFYSASGMTANEFSLVSDKLTTSTAKTLTGLINVNTAPEEVLMCLPGLTQSDADQLISERQSASDTASIGWVFQTLSSSKVRSVAKYITARSFIYSADIVAVSGDGRAFKRVRIVVDSQAIPASIVYRKDLTSLGWPLPLSIKSALKAGQVPPTGLSGSIGNFDQR
jgi:DNA uptake protein ComE-like DNA-binding protein